MAYESSPPVSPKGELTTASGGHSKANVVDRELEESVKLAKLCNPDALLLETTKEALDKAIFALAYRV